MFEQAFKNIDDVLRKEAGCTTELDYTEQTSWLLFLKYLRPTCKESLQVRQFSCPEIPDNWPGIHQHLSLQIIETPL